ncbi:metal-dependent hydrolase [Ferrimonas pelagia]|uniref:Metal-dependent hydrolase n=2 Tax=Ferrimonas pelagia TaxID=1177826 RepID=A0ABP9EG35_9GAMM
MLIDSHCHLDLPPLAGELDAVLARAAAQGVSGYLVPAVDRGHWPALECLSQRDASVAVAIGLHPCFAHQPDDVEHMAARLSVPHPYVAIGECGLDAIGSPLPLPQQEHLCRAQLRLAQQHELPVILHVRKAHNELLRLLNEIPLSAGGVVHGFSGSTALAQQYIKRGLKLGIGGTITYPRAAKTRAAVAALPLTSLLLETDSPDMPICGHQGETNEPARLPHILSQLARLRGCDPKELIEPLAYNVAELFPRWQCQPQITAANPSISD